MKLLFILLSTVYCLAIANLLQGADKRRTDPVKIRVVAYNVACAQWATVKQVANELKPLQADVILLSEVPKLNKNSQGEAWAKTLAQQLGFKHCFTGSISSANHKSPKWPDKTGLYGGKFKAILSRTPLSNQHDIVLKGKGWHPASSVRADTVIAGTTITLYALHIPGIHDWSKSTHRRLAVEILNYNFGKNAIVGGDFNEFGDTDVIVQLLKQSHLLNAVTKRSIDHILYDNRHAIKFIDCDESWGTKISSGSPEGYLSDHPYVWADFTITPNGFNHATMTKDKVTKIQSEAKRFCQQVKLADLADEFIKPTELKFTEQGDKIVATLLLNNHSDYPVKYELKWEQTAGWNFIDSNKLGKLTPGAKKLITVSYSKHNSTIDAPYPLATLNITMNKEFRRHKTLTTAPSLRPLNRPEFKFLPFKGKIEPTQTINHKLCSQRYQLGNLAKIYGGTGTPKTTAYMTYDTKYLYLTVIAQEPKMKKLTTEVKQHDSHIWTDDSIEFFISTGTDQAKYYHLAANTNGVIYDAAGFDRNYNINPLVATAIMADRWLIQLSIPWQGIAVKQLDELTSVRFVVVRNRPQTHETLQLPPLYAGNHSPKMFGVLKKDI